MKPSILTHNFFDRPTLTVARDLLGQRLVRQVDGQRLSGIIVETEAYIGPADTACHASKGRTPRTEVMFGPPGRAYIYLIYGMYHMLNLVTEAENFPAAVLIRALEPVEGVAQMQARRNSAGAHQLANGPGKLCRALAIDLALNNQPVTMGEGLWLEPGVPLPETRIVAGPRVGIDYARPEDRAAPWRFWIKGHAAVSR